ncbi:tRNA-dihydrouridine synthase [Haladaptatus sp. YSMS36]|uniref:tRNA-dihydrouridine synthase n=1 Tax=Haladaptatus sp. YSMS36 TaxID=3033384 RepID=UPI0023E8D775|nr:tRNA-dihydrouridine synthase [Haladaptatus sp. YSMS36]
MFEPRVALASLSGESDAQWARRGAAHAGAAFLGGVSLDDQTRDAARKLVARDRTEFLPADPIAFIDTELGALAETTLQPGVNVRTVTAEPVREAAAVCERHDAILELNAHCRQDEMCAVGAGETLLADTERLCKYVDVAAETGATVSVKVRAEVEGVDLAETASGVETAGADILHVDAMDSEAVIAEVSNADLFVIANNGVRGTETVREYLAFGADAVSVGRPSDNPTVLARVRRATQQWFGGRP